MPIAMAGHFVSVARGLLHQSRKALGNPTQEEKRSANSVGGEKFEEPLGIALDPQRHALPIFPRDRLTHALGVEIVLDVDAHRVRRQAWIRPLHRAVFRWNHETPFCPRHGACRTKTPVRRHV